MGLEVHQQLATGRKLFCGCRPIESVEFPIRFSRRLRAAKSEMGQYDAAALFEGIKSNTFSYRANPESSCLVEQDEEPPHELDAESEKTALIIAQALGSKIFGEIYPMRKMVVDGSNTSGFQRTMLVSQGGRLDAGGTSVGVQSICLEEDAARLLDKQDGLREYSLDRLGVPLVEIALEPVAAGPAQMRDIALALGRLLRTTRRVARGLGTIRQDVNVSIKGGGIVEVKGVQQLDQLEKVVQYEMIRQHGLLIIAGEIKKRGLEKPGYDVHDITEALSGCTSKIIAAALSGGHTIKAVKVDGFAGLFSLSPYENIRLGKELGELARAFGIGGIFHSDELPGYGIGQKETDMIAGIVGADRSDAFFVIAGSPEKIDSVIDAISDRITGAFDGPPAETRVATATGQTVFLRPRPGASRMYPETDILPIVVTQKKLELARNSIPKSWDDSIAEIQQKYKLNAQLAEQIFDSEYIRLFEDICSRQDVSPTLVASTLCYTVTGLRRRGLDDTRLDDKKIAESFELLAADRISRESIPIIYESVMSGRSESIADAVSSESIKMVSTDHLEEILGKIVDENIDLVKKQGVRSAGALMGTAMKSLRGKADGKVISEILRQKISDALNKNN